MTVVAGSVTFERPTGPELVKLLTVGPTVETRSVVELTPGKSMDTIAPGSVAVGTDELNAVVRASPVASTVVATVFTLVTV